MKLEIEAFILCYNEEKMIRHTLNHYSQFCSQITIIDNHSNDNTIEIIKSEYPTVKIKQYDTKGQLRDDAYQFIKNTCWQKSTADFVIVCDMDELLYHPNLIEELNKAKQNNFAIINTEGYNMFSQIFPENYTQSIISQVHQGVRAYNFDKNIIFSPKYIEKMNFQPGAHTCQPKYINKLPDIRPTVKFKLLHYKYLSYDYLLQKHLQYALRLSQYNKTYNFGGEYLKGEIHLQECFKQLNNTKLTNIL